MKDWFNKNRQRLVPVLSLAFAFCSCAVATAACLSDPWYELVVRPFEPFSERAGEELEKRFWPTATPDWESRRDGSDFVRRFWRVEMAVFDTGQLDSLEYFFCTDGRFMAPLLEPFDPFSQYKADEENVMASGLCPFALDDVQFPEDAPSAESGKLQVVTVERWAEGPCPTDGSSGLEGRHRRFVLERGHSGWCIAEYSPWRVVPE